MRTTGCMGEITGMAAAICQKNNYLPRDVYTNYLGELKDLMKRGTSKEATNASPTSR